MNIWKRFFIVLMVLLNIVCFVLEIGLNDSNIGVVWFMINITALVGLGTNHADGYF